MSSDGRSVTVDIQSPDSGGIATGRHTVNIQSNSIAGYIVTVEGSGGSTALVPVDFGGSTTTNNHLINPVSGTLASPSTLSSNTWGMAIPGRGSYSAEAVYTAGLPAANGGTNGGVENVANQATLRTATFGQIPSKTSAATVIESNQASGPAHDGSAADIQNIYYGVNTEPTLQAGEYSTTITYTATVRLPATPTNLSVQPNKYKLGSGEPNTITISATSGLASTYNVWIDLNSNNTYDANEQCTNLNVASDTTLTCNIPTDESITTDTPYTIYVQTQASVPAPITNAFTYTKPSICRNADPDSDCQVDIDDNMVPVVYDGYDGNGGGSWRIATKEEIESDSGSWYDYGKKQWANAITLRDDYEGGCFLVTTTGAVISQGSSNCSNSSGTSTRYTPLGLAKAWRDGELSVRSVENLNRTLFGADVFDGTSKTEFILGYWVYIPRYAYEVQRRDAYNPTNQTSANSAVSAQNFDIVFETNSDPVKQPIECNTGDYQTCVKNQYGESALNYPNTTSQDDQLNNQTAWATHPAFTRKYTQAINGFDQTTELNGFWIGKFETTGTRTAPTVKPNQHANVSEYIGEFYSAAKSIGVDDPNNKYGGANYDDTTSGLTPNSHHLTALTSHMLKNSEWGAVAYLSASKYGAGVNKVQINAARLTSDSTDADGATAQYGVTGCGPEANGVEDYYDAGTLNKTIIESTTACGSADRAYNGTIGQYASTTNNVYGVYDMSGGAWEYVMGNYSTNLSQTSNSSNNYGEVKAPIKPPYVDIYNITSNNSCTWNTSGSGCGGHALFETGSWGGDFSSFVYSSAPWFERGGYSDYGSYAGVFASSSLYGFYYPTLGFRVALLAVPQDNL